MKVNNTGLDQSEYKKRNASWLWDLRKASWENSVELIEESEILIKRKKYARSFFLAYTALEELGKYLFVCDYITGLVTEEEFKSSFSDHGNKIAYAHNNVNITKNENGNHEFTLVYDKQKFKDWMVFRNNALYTGIRGENEIIRPKDEIAEEYAGKMLERAKKERDDITTYEGMNEIIGSKAFYK